MIEKVKRRMMSVMVSDIRGFDLEFQVAVIGQEIDERKNRRMQGSNFKHWFFSDLPETDASARTKERLLRQISNDIGTFMEQRDGRQRDWEPIGI